MADTSTESTRVEISKKLVLINSASSLVTRMLSISVLIWLQQYLLKRITPEEYSLLPVLYSVMAFAPLLTFALTAGLGRYIVEAYARHDDKRITQIVSTMFPILCGAGLVFLAVGWTFAWHIDKILNIAPERLWDARIMMALLMFSAAVTLPVSPFGVGFFVRQKFVLQNLIGVGTEVFRLSLLFTLLFGISTRVLWVVTASACAGILGQIINVVISRRLVPTLRFCPSYIHWPIAKELTSFGGWSFVVQFANTIRSSADPIILNRLAGSFDVTCFYLGSLPFRLLQQFHLAARSSLPPVVMGLYAKEEYVRLQSIYLRVGRYSLWTSLFVAVPAIIFSQELMTLYVGSGFVRAGYVMALMLAIFPTSYGNCLLSVIAEAANAVRLLAIRFLLMHSVNLGLTLYLILYWDLGAVGSAMATLSVGIIFQPLLMWPLGWRLTRMKPGRWLRETFLPGCMPALACTAVCLPLKRFLPMSSWSTLPGSVAVGALMYLAVLGAFCLQPTDKNDLSRILKRGRDMCRSLANRDHHI